MIGTLTVGETVKAQKAAASLERVEAGNIDAPDECGMERCRESRRVCFNTGAFVLTARPRSAASDGGWPRRFSPSSSPPSGPLDEPTQPIRTCGLVDAPVSVPFPSHSSRHGIAPDRP